MSLEVCHQLHVFAVNDVHWIKVCSYIFQLSKIATIFKVFLTFLKVGSQYTYVTSYKLILFHMTFLIKGREQILSADFSRNLILQ